MMQKNCSRCHQPITCNTQNITQCDCYSIQLSAETKTYLSKTNYDCLCNKCLAEVESYKILMHLYPFPNHPSAYKENIHYYIEGNYWVFTNYYHYLKGSCCQNNCRHCAYGFNNKSI